jgi:putative membrane-bound dehydrogenase-like protein
MPIRSAVFRHLARGRAAVLLVTAALGAVNSLPATARAQVKPEANTKRGPLSPTSTMGRIALPEGFQVSLFAAEPDVVQPIAMTIDPRGRLWVVENYAYPLWKGGPHGKDRILIFEDADGDGRFDRRTVFWDRGTNLSGIELGFGGVWVCSTPNLLFIPDKNGDDRPDGEPVIMLDGWDVKAEHNLFNGLKWAPDGWLWGCNGILSRSRVGKPGTPDQDRVEINCGVWRYHPTRGVFEAVAHGTTNPWGLDFDDLGEAFITNCVIPHLFHVLPGSHFQRMFGSDMMTHSYALLETCADHIHWAGGRWTDSREGKGQHGEAGGGHAHVGAMIYLGDNWPDKFRNGVFTCNIHGHRVNHDRLERRGSGYVAHHEPDFLKVADPWFRGLELKYGPDGAVYLTDWYDTGECHEADADGSHRENGRIYKISFGKTTGAAVDLARETDESLAKLQLHKNDWYVRTARRLLQERTAAGRDLSGAKRVLGEILASNPEVPRKLRAIWALNAMNGLDQAARLALLGHASEDVRAWGVRLLADAETPSPAVLDRLSALAHSDPSPKVRLSLASALQRIPVTTRWNVARGLLAHGQDASDRALPLMIWYGIEPAVALDGRQAIDLMSEIQIPIVREFVARRAVSADPDSGLDAVASTLMKADSQVCRDLLLGAREALQGRKQTKTPANWPAAYERLLTLNDKAIEESTLLLALDFNDPRATARLLETVKTRSNSPDYRQRALTALLDRRVPGLSRDLQGLLDDTAMRTQAIRALAAYDDMATPGLILMRYPGLAPPDRDDAIATLAARPAWAKALLDAIGRGEIPRRDLTVTTARQLQALGDPTVNTLLERVWGKIQPTSTEKSSLIASYKSTLSSDQLPPADPARGRSIFNRTCLACHRLFDAGGDVGPDLTGSDRATADYILENVLDPSAAVSRDYTLSSVATTDGRVISGIIRHQTETSVIVQTANERIILPREDIEAIKPSSVSMMPEGQLERLSPREVRDLFAYLASTRQVPASSEEK